MPPQTTYKWVAYEILPLEQQQGYDSDDERAETRRTQGIVL